MGSIAPTTDTGCKNPLPLGLQNPTSLGLLTHIIGLYIHGHTSFQPSSSTMGPVTSKPRAQTVLGITVDDATKSLYQSQLITLLLPDITRRLASELTAVRPPADPDPDPASSFHLTIFAPAFKPKTGMLTNIKLVILATEHLRCTLTSLNLLADLKQFVGQWRRNLAAVPSQVQSRVKPKKHDSQRKLAELLRRLYDDLSAYNLRAVEEQQMSLLRELRKEKSELEEKLSSHNKWRGRWSAIYTTAFFTVLAGSVALAAVAAPTPAMTAATVVSTAMKAAEPWFDTLWDGRKAVLEGEKDVIKAMVRDVCAQLHELDSVNAHVDKLKVEVGSFFDLKTNEEYALAFEEVEKGIDALDEMADGIQGDMKKAAADFVRMIADET